MHGRLCPKPEENGAVDSLEMPVPTASGGRTRRTGLLTVMERPPGKNKNNTIPDISFDSYFFTHYKHHLACKIHPSSHTFTLNTIDTYFCRFFSIVSL